MVRERQAGQAEVAHQGTEREVGTREKNGARRVEADEQVAAWRGIGSGQKRVKERGVGGEREEQ